jgi:hypothetical protein
METQLLVDSCIPVIPSADLEQTPAMTSAKWASLNLTSRAGPDTIAGSPIRSPQQETSTLPCQRTP